MAIWQVELDTRESTRYRKWLKSRGFVSANYFSSNGFDLTEMRQMVMAGKMDAIRCVIGQSIRWYYPENQAELARLKGDLS